MFKKLTILALLLLIVAKLSYAQTFPVTASTQIIPPYSTYLADYVAPGTNRLALNIFLGDVNRPELQVKLKLSIIGQGIRIETKPEYLPPALILQGGVPERLIASDLAEYFRPENLNFQGITRQQFQRTGQLPEGLYQFCFEVLEYNRSIKISNSACAIAWLILNDPPVVNIPRNGEKLRPLDPQYVTFQWTPRHTGSPNSAFATEYEFSMVEIWPEGRNPNDAILTSPPIYQTTTQSTTLIYGPAETPLVPGRHYAFRIRAKSISGFDELDLFKNQGYSQTYSFIYGDACTLPQNITAEVINSAKFKVKWQSNFNHTNFTVRYREANANSQWYQAESFFDDKEIRGLKEATKYEYQVMAGCGPFTSEFSPIAYATTDSPPEIEYSCGLPPEEFNIGNTQPLPTLNNGDIIYAGDFDIRVSEATGWAGTFSGKGTVKVPYLDNLIVSVDFTGISINTDYRMTSGSMNVEGIGVDVLPDNVTDFIDKLDETLASVDDVLGDVNNGLDVADEILDEVGDLANDIMDNGPFTTEEEAKYAELTVDGYLDEAKNAIREAGDALSGGATVESIAKAAKKIAQATTLKIRANKLKDIYANSDTIKVQAVEFYANASGTPDGKFGFDISGHPQHRLHYNIMVLPDNTTVPVPWAASKAGEQTQIKVKWLPNSGVPADSIIFKSGADGETLSAGRSGNEWTIMLPQISSGQSLVVNAVNSASNNIVGKLNAFGYETLPRKVHIIPVGNSAANFTEEELTSYLNKVYAQALANWDVTLEAAIQVPNYTGTLQDDEQTMLSTYSDGMKAIIKGYKATEDITIIDNEFYLFLVDKSQTGKSGYMPRKHQFGFIYMGESGDTKRTIAHELGHGAFRLQHTWEEYPGIAQGTSNNLMDYGTGTQLRKYQWDLIHNPPIVIGLVEDLDEGASEGGNLLDQFIAKQQELSIELNSKIYSVIHCENCEKSSGDQIVDGITFQGYSINQTSDLIYNKFFQKTASIVGIERIRKDEAVCFAYYFSIDTNETIEFELEKETQKPTEEILLEKKLFLLDQDNKVGYTCNDQLGDWSIKICTFQTISDLTQSYVDDLFKHLDNCQNDFADLVNKYQGLSPKQVTYIYEDDQLISIDPQNGLNVKNFSQAEFEQLLAKLKNDDLSDYEAIVYKKLTQGYQVHINFGKEIIPKAGYDPNGTAKDDTELILEQLLNLKLSSVNSLMDANAQDDPGVFNDGKKINIKETNWWESISNLVSATNEFISDVEIKEKYWNSADSNYPDNWINTPPFLTGGGNAIIEEIKDIPQLVAMVANIALDKPTRDQLWTSLKDLDTKKIINGLYGMGESYVNTFAEGGDPAWHQGGKTVVQVAAIVMTSGIKKGADAVKDNIDDIAGELKKKADDVLKESLDILADLKSKVELDDISWSKFETDFRDDIVNLKKFGDKPELVDSWRVLGESADLRKNIDALKTIEFYTKNVNGNIDELADAFKAASNKEDWLSGVIREIRSKARGLPGTSKGSGITIDGKWMRGTEGNAGLFPKSIADKLQGKNFKNFDEFRGEFWKAAADDPNLAHQFSSSNITLMKQGKAPIPVEEQWLGGRMTYEIHHKTPIHDGGGVYDMDNMVVVTPRYHKEILDPAYHFNK